MNPAYDIVTMARDVVASCASDPSLRPALGLNVSTTEIPDGDTKATLFLTKEFAAAQEAQACILALGGNIMANAMPTDEMPGLSVKSGRNMKNDDSGEALRNFLAYRSSVALIESPLSITFPHVEGLRVAGDLVMVRVTACTINDSSKLADISHYCKHRFSSPFVVPFFQVRLALDLNHCVHDFPWRGTDYDRCRQLFLYDTEICAWIEQHNDNVIHLDEGKESGINKSSPTCGPPSDILAGGVQLHGLSPGTYTLYISMSFLNKHQQPSDEGEVSLATNQVSCSDFSSSLWQLADLTRTFVIKDDDSPNAVVADTIKAPGKHHLSRVMASSSADCGSYEDDSEWCIYRPACLEIATLGLVLLNLAPDSQDTPFQLGRKDDYSFVPTSLDRSSWGEPEVSNNDLPHRSAALTRHLSAASFADAEKRGAVAWFDPDSDDDKIYDGGSSNHRANRVGLMFVDSPMNIYHSATKAFQLSYAAKEPSESRLRNRHGSQLDAVVPLSCTLKGCQPAHATHENVPAAAWLDGLLSILFSNATTQVIHDPRAWASAIHEKTSPTTSKSPVELLCFREVAIPGENRALFRGPADARRFRFIARRYLGLSPAVMHLPPKVLGSLRYSLKDVYQ